MALGAGEMFAGYTVVGRLGSGGMGEVYLARHPRLPREDALKVLRPEVSADDEFRRRFIREADLAAALTQGPHIVTVHDRGECDGQLWIATQYIAGTDAARLLRERFPAGMPVEEAVVVIAAIAEALDFAHDSGLVHRDIKPANILLSDPDPRGRRRVYLADFGIARPLDDLSALTATNTTLGTFAYSAPEQLMGQDLDGRADQYALAATAFDLLTGTPPFTAPSNPVAVIGQHLNAAPPAASKYRPELAPLDDILARGLAKDPAQRFPSCTDFAAALTARAAAIPVTSPHAGTQVATPTFPPHAPTRPARPTPPVDEPAPPRKVPPPATPAPRPTPSTPKKSPPTPHPAKKIVGREPARPILPKDPARNDAEQSRRSGPQNKAQAKRGATAPASKTADNNKGSSKTQGSARIPLRDANGDFVYDINGNRVYQVNDAAVHDVVDRCLADRLMTDSGKFTSTGKVIIGAFGLALLVPVVLLLLGKCAPSQDSTAALPTTTAASSSTPARGGEGQLPVFTAPADLGANCQYPAAGPAVKKVDPPKSGKVPTDPATVSVSMSTNEGNIGLILNNAEAPCTVNSFASLAQKGFFDDTVCHRLTTADSLGVLQCGDPSETGTGGPGYQFANEYPTDQYDKGDPALQKQVLYPRGTLAMANAGPGTNGSQFFLVYKDSKLPPNYTVFGTIDATGLATLDKIAEAGVAGGGNDGKPATEVVVRSIQLD